MTLNRKMIAIAILSAMALASSALAHKGVDKFETGWTFSEFYVACLGEMITGDVSVVAKYHEFDTPSGKFHLVDTWQYTLLLTG